MYGGWRVNRAMLLAGSLAATATPAAAQKATGEEVVLRAEAKPEGLEFRVSTGGCTRKSSFGVETLTLSPLTVRLVRLRPDYCEALVPDGTAITFTYAELGARPSLSETERRNVVILNTQVSP